MRILEVIRDRDSDLAEILMRRHVAAARESFQTSLRLMAPAGCSPEASYNLLTGKTNNESVEGTS
jgi:hypothetical protein